MLLLLLGGGRPPLILLLLPLPPPLRPWAELDEMKPGSSSGVSLPPLPADEEAKRPWAEYDGRLYLSLLEFRLILCCLVCAFVWRMYAALLALGIVSAPLFRSKILCLALEQDCPIREFGLAGRREDTGRFRDEMCRQ